MTDTTTEYLPILRARLANEVEARRFAEMSDDFFYTNGRAAEFDKRIAALNEQIKEQTK